MANIFIVSVSNNETIYNQAIANNPNLANCQIIKYDNSQENLAIPVRYNHFIEHQLNGQDGWLVFCHQDFEWLQKPEEVLNDLDKNCVYGPIGVTSKEYSSLHLIFHTYRFRPSIRKKKEFQTLVLGGIFQGFPKKDYPIGKRLSKPTPVDTVDCCCIIVHSSLVRKYGLKFDEIFDFHLYTEDFCRAAAQHDIKVMAVQCACRHYSEGKITEDFWKKYDKLLDKYPEDFFLTTCALYTKQAVQRKLRHLSPKWIEAAKSVLSNSR